MYVFSTVILTMPYPIMPVGVVAGKAMIDGACGDDTDRPKFIKRNDKHHSSYLEGKDEHREKAATLQRQTA